ncbi:molybdopterin-dependent oxidoreductase [Novosphingobium sp. NBM11]|jgi:DMSO/TMAO reductase YedYZ molybdopterin-dependent catalytic subunit|uniref:molybdopterin-dependent oxidoreductase n=1 Tax=Novosphingobium sp. NBM11 TaxID=2596914 RepID=UPI00189237AF|nr:molybdopterin-dependent oxidoreductase [Novosphingobium sp. NBM11]MBF5089269.1 molybdopterin-dependent oxidoreductase [Novosphingobium sp. NBM11]
MTIITRRNALIGGAGLLLSGCDRIAASPSVREVLTLGEKATRTAQRIVTDRNALAREFTRADLSPVFRENGTRNPGSPDYAAHAAERFANWRLVVDGMVAQPLAIGLAQILAAPQRTQITRHDCVEGWSAIGQWTGLPLGLLLRRAGLSGNAKYIVFHCADLYDGAPYYESIDLVDAFHPQTILAHSLNGQSLSIGHGAPLRLRVERQLGYKQAKYVMRIQAVSSLADIYGGKGGYWEDHHDYQWYAGI